MGRKTLQQRRERDAAKSNPDPAQFANRIEEIKQDLESSNDPEDLMLMIMEALNDTVAPIPDVGNTIPLYIMLRLLDNTTNIH